MERSDIVATFTFDRPLDITPEGTERFWEIYSMPVESDNIKPYSDADREESMELIKKYWHKNRNKNMRSG